MTWLKKKNLVIGTMIIVALIALDQWVKSLAVLNLKGNFGTSYLGNFIRIEYAENRGAFLSLGSTLSESARLWVFVGGVILILGFCFYSLVKNLEHLPSVIAYAMVIAGGMGNLVDRAVNGYVVDFIHMGFGGLRTGVFNVADVAISAGLIFLVFIQYRLPAKKDA